MRGNSKIEAVTFDAGGTLIHLRESVGETYSEIAGEFDIKADSELLEKWFRYHWKRFDPPFHNTESEISCEKDWWRKLVMAVFCSAVEGFAGEDERFEPFFDRLYDHYAQPDVWELDSEALEVFEWLESERIRVGMISNFDERLRGILLGLGIEKWFEAPVISNEVRVSKPDRRIFELAAQSLELPTEKILHVGDDLICDQKGAEAAGMRALLVGKGIGLSEVRNHTL